jgi:hypothetical protein
MIVVKHSPLAGELFALCALPHWSEILSIRVALSVIEHPALWFIQRVQLPWPSYRVSSKFGPCTECSVDTELAQGVGMTIYLLQTYY